MLPVCLFFLCGRQQRRGGEGSVRGALSAEAASERASEQPFLKDGPVLLRFTGKHVGHPALFLL